MGLLGKAVKGYIEKPQVMLVYGVNGVGKSTFASQWPAPFFADLEGGSMELNVERLTPIEIPTLKHVTDLIAELHEGEHSYKTFVIDSLEALEIMIHQKICKDGNVESIERFDGGFGKGYVKSREIMSDIMRSLQRLRDHRNMSVILIGHSQIKQHLDPATGLAYDRHTLRVNDKLGSLVKDLCDAVLFGTHKVYTKNDGRRVQAFSDNERVLLTEWRASHDAKNRIGLPYEIELNYAAFRAAAQNARPKSSEQLVSEINELVKSLPDEAMKAAVLEAVTKANGESAKLSSILNRVRQKVEGL